MFSIHSIPYEIISDNRPHFQKSNKEIKHFRKEMGIHPQGIRNSFAQKINKKQFSHIILKGDSGNKIFCIFIDQHHPCLANEPS